jgi:hypothetical protein
LGNLKDDDYFGEEEEIDKVLMILFFLVFAVAGFALAHFL